MFKVLDRFICKSCKISGHREKEFIGNRKNSNYLDSIHYDMDAIDNKSSALLTHISLMFVVLSIFLVASDAHAFIQVLLGIELIAYLCIAMLLLRCIDVMGPPLRPLPSDRDGVDEAFYVEVTLRREVYQRSMRAVYLLTFFLIPIVLGKFALQ